MSSDTSRLATKKQAAQYFQTTPRTIENWIGAGYIPGYRLRSRVILVDLDDIEAAFKRYPQKMRDGRRPYGPKARIVDLGQRAEAVTEEGDQ